MTGGALRVATRASAHRTTPPDSADPISTPDPAGRVVAVLRLVATLTALGVGQVILWRSGSVLPALPQVGADWAASWAEAEPLAVAMSLLRVVALGLGTALIASTVMGAVARGCGAARLVVRLDRWTPSGLCHLLDGALGAGLAASIGLSALPAGADPSEPPVPVATSLRRLPDGSSTTTLRRLPDDHPPADATLRRIPDGQPPPQRPAPAPAPAAATPREEEVVVRPGDSFWRLAERHETERLGRRPSEAEVGACWQTMIGANRHRLVVPGDPDLIFPGQVLIVPWP